MWGFDGTRVEVRADGTVAGSSLPRNEQGNVVIHHDNGTVTTVSSADGSIHVQHADGSTTDQIGNRLVTGDGHGSTAAPHPDGGAVTVTHADGTMSRVAGDGTHFTLDEHGVPHTRHDSGPTDGQHLLDRENRSTSGVTHNGTMDANAEIPGELQRLERQGQLVFETDGDRITIRMARRVSEIFHFGDRTLDTGELRRQLGLQQHGMNEMTVHEIKENLKRFEERGRNDAAQNAMRQERFAARLQELRRTEPDLTEEQLREQVQVELADEAPLHGPDQAGGGYPDHLTGWGDRSANSAIGAHWNEATRQGLLRRIRTQLAESGIPEEYWGDVKVNVDFLINGKHW